MLYEVITLVLGAGFLVLTLSSHQALINLGWLVTSTMVFSALATFLLLPAMVLWLRPQPGPDAIRRQLSDPMPTPTTTLTPDI